MKENQNLKRNLIAEKFIFNSRSRKQGENRSNYMAELRRWFQYEDSLEEVLRDRLLCGLNRKRMQQLLLNIGASLTLQKALDIALLLESVIWQVEAVQNKIQKENGDE